MRHFGQGITAAWLSPGPYTVVDTLLPASDFWYRRWLNVKVERANG